MIAAEELTSLRAAHEGNLPDLCDILTVATSRDAQGGPTETETARATAVPCAVALSIRLPEEQLIAERLRASVLATVIVPAETTVLPSDRIRVTTQGNRLFEVVAGAGRSTEVARRVICREIV